MSLCACSVPHGKLPAARTRMEFALSELLQEKLEQGADVNELVNAHNKAVWRLTAAKATVLEALKCAQTLRVELSQQNCCVADVERQLSKMCELLLSQLRE